MHIIGAVGGPWVAAVRELVQRLIAQWVGWCRKQVGAVGQFVQYVSEMRSRLVGAICESIE